MKCLTMCFVVKIHYITFDGLNWILKKMEGNTNQDGQVPDTGQENGEFSEQDHEKLTWVLSGNLDSLPAQSSKIVRIFTSSTFTGKSYCGSF